MKDKYLIKYILFIILLLFITTFSFSLSGGHRGNITDLIHLGNSVLTVGEDGFLVTWDTRQRTAIDRFQLTTFKIQSMVKHPGKSEICIIESVSLDSYRISVWNFQTKEKLFTVYSSKPVTYVNYSAQGSYILASGLDGFYLSIINSQTGQILNDPLVSSGNVTLAITGRTERNLLLYQSEHVDEYGRSTFRGLIQYLDLESLSVSRSFLAPAYLTTPIILGNSRFLAGINQDGLLLIDTTSGNVLDRNENISRNALIFQVSDEFYCLDKRGENFLFFRFTVDRNGRLVMRNQQSITMDNSNSIASFAYNGNLIFTTSRGDLFFYGQQNRIIPFHYNFQTQIEEIALGNNSIALLKENNYFILLPLDYNLIDNSFNIEFTEYSNYNKISHFTVSNVDYYILWQTSNTRFAPILINENRNLQINLNFLSGRFPLRSVSIFNNRLLILDTGGNITVYDVNTVLSGNIPRPDFTFSSIGAIDAAFISNDYITISRSSINNSSPFLSVNLRTAETIPYFFPLHAGLMIFPSRSSNNIYAVGVEQNESMKTVFFNLSAPSQPRIFEYNGEANYFSITESQGRLVISCDSAGILILTDRITRFERTSGLPVKVLSNGDNFISLDTEGNLVWFNNNGRVQAALSFNNDVWRLSGSREITGRIQKASTLP